MYYLVALTLKLLLFIFMTRVSHQVFLVFLVSSLLVSTILMAMYRYTTRFKYQVVLLFYILVSLLMFADVIYFTYFNRLITLSVKSQLGQIPGVLNVISFLLNQKILLFIIDIPVLLFYFYKKKSCYLKPLKNRLFYLKIVPMIVIIAVIQINHLETVKAFEFFTYHTTDLIDQVIEDDADESIDLETIKTLQLNNKKIEGPLTGIAKGKNLIMIQVEALQNIAINLSIQGHEITPHLNQLIQDQGSLYFDNVFQSVGRGNTSDAEFATLNSLYPSANEIVYETYHENTYYSLAHMLKEQGYRNAYFHANDGQFYNRETMSKQLGFDEFYELEDYKFVEDEFISYGLNDFDFYQQSLYRLQQLEKHNPEGWMAFLISMSSHTPFTLEQQDKTLTLDNPNNNIALSYFESLHYADAALGEFIEGLKEKNLYEDSVIVIYGDHFGINAQHDETKLVMQEAIKSNYTVEDMFNVPLIVHIPNTTIQQTISKVGSQIDIYPTLINLFGLQNEKGVMFGQDLINSKKYNAAFPMFYITENSFIDDEFIYLSSRDQDDDYAQLISRSTNEILEPTMVSHKLQENKEIIEISQLILKLDLFKQLLGK